MAEGVELQRPSVFVPRTIRTEEALAEMVERYMELDEFAFDLETKASADGPATNVRYNVITWLSFAGPGMSDAIPVGHINGEIDVPQHTEKYEVLDPKGGEYKTGPRKGMPRMVKRTRTIPPTYQTPPKQLPTGVVIEALRPLFFSERTKVGHNVKFDLGTLSRYFGEDIPMPWADTIGLHQLLNENQNDYRLGALTKSVFGSTYPKIGGATPHLQPFSEAAKYALRDAQWTWLLWDLFADQLEAQGLMPVWQLEMEDLAPIMTMEREGVPIDEVALEDLGRTLERQLVDIERAILKDAGKKLNLNANADKGWYVYEHRNHTPFAFTAKKKEPQTTKAVLDVYADKDPMVKKLQEFGELSKMKGTYVEGLQKHIVNGRLHAGFKPFGTVTGRFSCADPNLQNIPRVADADDEESAARGRLIRKMFRAPEGFYVVVADYDQVEYRLLAHLANDSRMIAAFNEGIDPHTGTAAAILQKDPSDVTGDERQKFGKTINFAVLYGAQAKKVAAQAGVSKAKAQGFLDSFWIQFPETAEWKDKTLSDARTRRPPHVTTLFGRRRRLPGLFFADEYDRYKAERQAINSIVQGSAADVIKMAMVKFHRLSVDTPHKLVLSVHDELAVFSPKEHVEEGCAMLEEAMAGDQFLSVPLLAEASYAETWGDAK